MHHASRTLLTLGAALALNLAPTLAGLDLAAARTTAATAPTHKVKKSSHEGEGPYVPPPPAPEVTTTTTTTSTTTAAAPPAAAPLPAPNLPSQAQAMVGCWSGAAFQPAVGQREAWVINRRPDGTFSITFWALDEEEDDDAAAAGASPDMGMDMGTDVDPALAAGMEMPVQPGSVYSPEGQTEAGQWSLEDGKETLVTTAINGVAQPGGARDVYEITRFTGQEIDYRHLASGQPFNTHRVDCGYRPTGLVGS